MNINTHDNVSIKKHRLHKPKLNIYNNSYDHYYNCQPIYESQFVDILKKRETYNTQRTPIETTVSPKFKDFFCRLKSLFSN